MLFFCFLQKAIHSIIAHPVDAAATGGPYNRGNSSQTPSRCSWAQTPGWTGPCCQTPSDEENRRSQKQFQEWSQNTFRPNCVNNSYYVNIYTNNTTTTNRLLEINEMNISLWPPPAALEANRRILGWREIPSETKWWWWRLQSETKKKRDC